MSRLNIGDAVAAALFGAIFAGIASATCFMWIVPLIILILGKSRAVPPKAIAPPYVWLLAAVLGGTGAGAASVVSLDFAPLFGALSVILASMMVAIYLRAMGSRHARTEFKMKNKYAYTARKPGKPIKPMSLVDDAEYHKIFATSGFYVYSIALTDADGVTRVNNYLDDEKFERDRERLIDETNCLALDLVIAVRQGENTLHSVRLDNEWTAILFGAMPELPENARAWWKEWIRPAFSPGAPVEIVSYYVLENIDAIERAYPELVSGGTSIKSNIDGIRYMAEVASSPMMLMTRELFEEYADDFAGKKRREAVYEDNVATIKRKE